MELKIKKVHPGAQAPSRATEGSAGMDLRACCEEEMVFAPMERKLVPTGIAIELPSPAYVALVCARSGLSFKQGLTMANGIGVVDSDYRGEMSVPMINLSDKEVRVANGERVAQLLVLPVEMPEIVEVDELNDTQRGQGGFGSTGAK